MNNINRPNYAAGFELDGPYRLSPSLRAQRLIAQLAGFLAGLMRRVKP